MNSAEDDLRRDEVTEFLLSYPPGIVTVADRLRALVVEAVPDVVERLRPGWHMIGYDIPVGRRTAYFAWVFPELEHVHLGWQTGTLMDDPDRLLHGAEENLKKARYLTFVPGARVSVRLVKDFTREAARIASMSRGERELLAAQRGTGPRAR